MYFQDIGSCVTMCSSCFSLLITIQSFADRCTKARKFFLYVESSGDAVGELQAVKRQFDLGGDSECGIEYVKTEAMDTKISGEKLGRLLAPSLTRFLQLLGSAISTNWSK